MILSGQVSSVRSSVIMRGQVNAEAGKYCVVVELAVEGGVNVVQRVAPTGV